LGFAKSTVHQNLGLLLSCRIQCVDCGFNFTASTHCWAFFDFLFLWAQPHN